MLHRYRPTYGVFPIAERIGMGKASEYRGKVEALRGG
jgi:hypothetical protein